MRLGVFVLAVLAFLLVAGLTVHLQVRASLRTYQLGRARETLHALDQRWKMTCTEVDRTYAPSRVHRVAQELRSERTALAEPAQP